MAQTLVSVVIGGSEYVGWRSMSYRATATSPERSFQLVGARSDIFDAMPGTGITAGTVAGWLKQPCSLLTDGDLIMTGEILDAEIELDAHNHEVRLSGKSLGHHTATTSVDHDTHEWPEGTTLDQIANDVDTPGIGYSTDEIMTPFPDKVRANVGETHLHFLGRLARKKGLFLTSKRDGGVALTTHGKYRHDGGIVEGVNFLRGTARFSAANTFSKVKVKHHNGRKTQRSESTIDNPQGRQGTVKVVVPRVAMDPADGNVYATHLINNRFGDSTQLQCELVGHRDMGGEIWEVGYLVWCEVPACDLSIDLAINELTLTQDEHETLAKMVLVHPSALGQKTGTKSTKFNKQGSGVWKNDLGKK